MPRLPAIQSARSISAEATDPYNADSTAVTANNIFSFSVFFFEKLWKTTSKPSVADLQTNKFLPEKNDFT